MAKNYHSMMEPGAKLSRDEHRELGKKYARWSRGPYDQDQRREYEELATKHRSLAKAVKHLNKHK